MVDVWAIGLINAVFNNVLANDVYSAQYGELVLNSSHYSWKVIWMAYTNTRASVHPDIVIDLCPIGVIKIIS